jgi:hypothetical protein
VGKPASLASTLRFWQEIYDDKNVLREIHKKFPVDLGHRKLQLLLMITKQNVAEKLGNYLHGELALRELVDWSENSIAEGEFESPKLLEIVARLGLADVRAFGLAWEDFQEILHALGFSAKVDLVAA